MAGSPNVTLSEPDVFCREGRRVSEKQRNDATLMGLRSPMLGWLLLYGGEYEH